MVARLSGLYQLLPAEGSKRRELDERDEAYRQRSTAKDLLQHKFIRSARSTSRLVELVTRYNAFRARSPAKKTTPSKTLSRQAGGGFGTITAGTLKSEWNFDETIRMTMKGAPVELDLAELSDDDEWDMGSRSGTARVRESGPLRLGNVSSMPPFTTWS